MPSIRRSISEHLRYLHEHPGLTIALDTETSDIEFEGPNGLRVDDGRAKCIGVSIAYRGDEYLMESFYIGIDHWVGDNCSDRVLAQLAAVVTDGRPIGFANVQFDMLSLLTIGIDVTEMPFFDIMTMAQFINENYPKTKSLDQLAVHYLPDGARKIAVWPWEAQFKLKWEKSHSWPNTTPEMMDDYARVDAELTLRILEMMLTDHRWREVPAEVWEHKQRFIRLLIRMRKVGVKIDQPLTRAWLDEGVARMKEINAELGLDLNKPGDIRHLFLERLELPVVRTTKPSKLHPEGQPSFDRFAMEIYEPMLEHDGRPEAKLFTEYQGWKTATGLLYRSWLDKVSPDGRLRTEFITHETVTGRLSSRNPNLQQVPRESKKYWNGHAKECFIEDDEWELWNADYSQLELRVATGYSKEPAAMETFNAGEDIFNRMTAELREQLAASVQNEQQRLLADRWDRNMTKVLVYRLQYGGGYKSLMLAYGTDEELSKSLLGNYRQAFPAFQALNRSITMRAEVEGQVRTWSGRVRHMAYESDSYKAMNSVIQGGSADIVERVMVRLDDLVCDENCQILLTVHDSVVFRIRKGMAEHYVPRLKAVMEDVDAVTAPGSFGVVFAVEVEKWKYTENGGRKAS